MHKIIRTDGRYSFDATADYAPGDLIVRPDGTPAILDGVEEVASGDLIEPQPVFPTMIIEFDSASATTFAAGASVYVNTTSGLATATNTDEYVGIAARAKTAGQTSVLVNCVPA